MHFSLFLVVLWTKGGAKTIKNISLKEDKESFDSALGVPLFRIGELVFSLHDIKKVQDEKIQ